MPDLLEKRRVQKLGQSTLMVSLPKPWVDQMNLKRGDTLNIASDELGRLLIHPSLEMLPTKTKCVINAEKVDDSLLGRLILGAYIAGHETIELRANVNGFNPSKLEMVRKTLTELIGVGIVEQGVKKISIQSFLDPSKFPIDGLISRLHLIVESMVDLALQALMEENDEFARQVLDMDFEADKVYFLATRQLLQAIEDKALAEKVGLANPKNIVGDRMVVKSLEEIGDHAEDIARRAIRLNALGYYNKSISDDIMLLRQRSKRIAEKAMTSLSSRDPLSANAAIVEYGLLAKDQERIDSDLERRVGPAGGTIATELKAINQSIEHIGSYYVIAAEVMINRAVESSTEITEVVKVA